MSPHYPVYKNLGQTDEERQMSYRELFRYELESGEIDKIRKATNGNFTLASNRFNEEISQMVGRRVTPGKPGRPRK
jgi:putative transposase